MKFAAGIEYKGTAFDGWQCQSHAPSVQDCLERALTKVANSPVRTVCAGRTDSGVHATGQVVHFESDAQRSEREWLQGCNAHTTKDIGLRWMSVVDASFDARRSAIRRHYRYVILNSLLQSPLLHDLSTHIYKPLSEQTMHQAAQALVGEHDFSSFRSAGCQSKTPVRQVYAITVCRDGRFIYIDVCANAFVQYMVRNIVGVLLEVGAGSQPEHWVADVLEKRDRTQGGVTASSNGLYLVKVEYDTRYGLPDDTVYPSFY
ncbi:MAG: tRNA pseudouridine(38-40) synthase TruA [Chromatiales bacterium]|nr:tRNA pseudouridine(38-40) synthase TruA [Chromatiales bacterium]